MEELVISLHMHTTYSDGTGSHTDIGEAALRAGLDAVIVTDHNVLVGGPERYYKEGRRRMLLLIGEEIHDQARQPQKSHLLVFNARRELASLAPDPQILIDNVRRAGGALPSTATTCQVWPSKRAHFAAQSARSSNKIAAVPSASKWSEGLQPDTSGCSSG